MTQSGWDFLGLIDFLSFNYTVRTYVERKGDIHPFIPAYLLFFHSVLLLRPLGWLAFHPPYDINIAGSVGDVMVLRGMSNSPGNAVAGRRLPA